MPWGVFLRTPAVWAINVAHFSFNFGYYTLMAWLPSYFELALGLNVQKSSLLTLIPYLAMMAMTPFVRPWARKAQFPSSLGFDVMNSSKGELYDMIERTVQPS